MGREVSDGIIFSEFLTRLFTAETQGVISERNVHSYASMVEILAIKLAEYLLGKRSLLHPPTGKKLQLDRPIHAHELAVLVQNKAYELTASEIEQRLFVRGRPAGDERDALDALDARERLQAIAANRHWNTLKDRAQGKAYEIVAREMLSAPDCATEDDWLWQKILDALSYKDHRIGAPLNLWALVAKHGAFG